MPTLKELMNPKNEIWIDNWYPAPDSHFWDDDILDLNEIDALLCANNLQANDDKKTPSTRSIPE